MAANSGPVKQFRSNREPESSVPAPTSLRAANAHAKQRELCAKPHTAPASELPGRHANGLSCRVLKGRSRNCWQRVRSIRMEPNKRIVKRAFLIRVSLSATVLQSLHSCRIQEIEIDRIDNTSGSAPHDCLQQPHSALFAEHQSSALLPSLITKRAFSRATSVASPADFTDFSTSSKSL